MDWGQLPDIYVFLTSAAALFSMYMLMEMMPGID